MSNIKFQLPKIFRSAKMALIFTSIKSSANGTETIKYYSDGTNTMELLPPYHYAPKSQMEIRVWYHSLDHSIDMMVNIDVPGKEDRISYEPLLRIFKQIEAVISIPSGFKRLDMIFVNYGNEKTRIEFTHLDEVLREPDVTLELAFI